MGNLSRNRAKALGRIKGKGKELLRGGNESKHACGQRGSVLRDDWASRDVGHEPQLKRSIKFGRSWEANNGRVQGELMVIDRDKYRLKYFFRTQRKFHQWKRGSRARWTAEVARMDKVLWWLRERMEICWVVMVVVVSLAGWPLSGVEWAAGLEPDQKVLSPSAGVTVTADLIRFGSGPKS